MGGTDQPAETERSLETDQSPGTDQSPETDRSPETDQTVYARFRIDLPQDTWVRTVSEAYPQATFRLLSGTRTDDTARELGEAITESPAAVRASMRDHDAILSYETLEETDGRLLGQYETTDVGLYGFLESSSMPPTFPVVVSDGRYELDVTVSPATFERFTAALRESDTRYELLSKVHTDDEATLLTDRQREVLAAALRHGYLAVPRDCSLAELAATLEADPSSVSTTLRRGQERLVTWFLTEAD